MKLFYHNIITKQSKGLKAFVISDIHYYSSKDNYKLNAIIKQLDQDNYDVIYLIGDIIDETNVLDDKETRETLTLFLKSLGNYAPTYIALGSHDLVYFNYDKTKKLINDDRFKEEILKISNTIPNLITTENKFLELPNGDYVSILNQISEYNKKNANINQEAIKEKYSFLEQVNSKQINTLLCHYPNYILFLDKLNLLDKIDLNIAGHNHNGMTQLKILPLESFLNLINQKNRGLVTPARSISLKETKYLRGVIELNNQKPLIIVPAITSLGYNTNLAMFDKFFYKGATVINYIPENKIKRKSS